VILTSHYMADVMALCPRVILIHHGRVLYDGDLNGLARQLAPFKLLRVTLGENGRTATNGQRSLPAGVEIIAQDNGQITLRVGRADTPAITAQVLQSLPVVDLTVEDPPIEAVIDQIYTEAGV
jgi:ABC-2 type transport system ATP-binding protein